MFFGMLYLPESPRWLVSSGRPLYEALEAAQFVNSDLTSEQIVNMKKEIERQVPTYQREDTAQNAAERLFCSPAMRIPMIVGMGLIIGQQVTGLPAMLYYCVDIFEAVSSKVIPVMEHLFCGGWMLHLRDHVSSPVCTLAQTTDLPTSHHISPVPQPLFLVRSLYGKVAEGKFMWALGSFGIAKLLGSVAVMFYIDSAGRRVFLISGLVLMFVSSGALFMLFFDSLKKVRRFVLFKTGLVLSYNAASLAPTQVVQFPQQDKTYQWAFVVLLDFFVIGYEFSVGSISFILLGEVFPGDLKAEALSIAFIASFSFLSAKFLWKSDSALRR